MRLTQRSSNIRISSGVAKLDEMCGGGFFKDSIILATGATGTGKTLLGQQVCGECSPQQGKGDRFSL